MQTNVNQTNVNQTNVNQTNVNNKYEVNLNKLIQAISNFKIQTKRKELQHVYNQSWYQNFYLKSSWWMKCINYYKEDSCAKCDSSTALQLHHLHYNLYNETEQDLITLCANCHKQTHCI